MCPDPLAGTRPNFALDHRRDPLDVPPQDFFVIGRPPFELECRLNLEPMGPSVRLSAREGGKYRKPALGRQCDRPIPRAGQAFEKGHENAFFTPGRSEMFIPWLSSMVSKPRSRIWRIIVSPSVFLLLFQHVEKAIMISRRETDTRVEFPSSRQVCQ